MSYRSEHSAGIASETRPPAVSQCASSPVSSVHRRAQSEPQATSAAHRACKSGGFGSSRAQASNSQSIPASNAQANTEGRR